MPRVAEILAERTIPGIGLIEYSEEPYRAYYFTPEGGGGRRKLPSVTTILREAWAKPGLIKWAARLGQEGMDRARDGSTDRGRVVHSLIENYLQTGELLDPSDYPDEYRPYLRSAARFIFELDPEPESVELLICHPEFDYAGRMDLRARVRGRSQVLDFKTSPNGAIYPEAHVQTFAYQLADERCGSAPAEGRLIIGISPEGYNAVQGADVADVWAAALHFYKLRRELLERLGARE